MCISLASSHISLSSAIVGCRLALASIHDREDEETVVGLNLRCRATGGGQRRGQSPEHEIRGGSEERLREREGGSEEIQPCAPHGRFAVPPLPLRHGRRRGSPPRPELRPPPPSPRGGLPRRRSRSSVRGGEVRDGRRRGRGRASGGGVAAGVRTPPPPQAPSPQLLYHGCLNSVDEEPPRRPRSTARKTRRPPPASICTIREEVRGRRRHAEMGPTAGAGDPPEGPRSNLSHRRSRSDVQAARPRKPCLAPLCPAPPSPAPSAPQGLPSLDCWRKRARCPREVGDETEIPS
ncbi:unnamed protein product [Urochloa humidicola]